MAGAERTAERQGIMPHKEELKYSQVEIKVDESSIRGKYANLVHIVHSPEDFTFDFIYLAPRPQVGLLEARVILSPQHAKRLLAALQDNITKYETTFGPIKPSPEPMETPGAVH